MLKQEVQKTVSKSSKRKWIIAGAVVGIPLVALVSFAAWFTYAGSAKEITSVANQFKPDSSWELKSESINPPANVCIDVECPSVFRQWKTEGLLTSDDLKELATQSGWNFPVEGDCKSDPNASGSPLPLCTATGVVDGYQVSLTVSGSSSPESERVSLNVKKDK